MKSDPADLAELLENQNFDEALVVLAAKESEGRLTPAELVLKGRWLQLSSGGKPALEEACRSFEAALEGDEDFVPALLELGWFFYAVEDDALRAETYFKKAIMIAQKLLTEAVVGKVQCLLETKSAEVAAEFLAEIRRRSLLEEDLPDEVHELLSRGR